MIAKILILIMYFILSPIYKNECLGMTKYDDIMNSWRLIMVENKNIIISAQVLLRPASGKPIALDVAITSDNLPEYTPSPETVASAGKIFRVNGFEVGQMVGVSFSISGTIQKFEKFFETQVRIGNDGINEFVVNGKVIGQELAGEQLPKELQSYVAVVAFPGTFELDL